MSLRIDTTEWISGALLIGDAGGGVIAQNLATAGDNGSGYLYDDVTLPADNGKEICGRITTWPSGLSLYAYEDGSVISSAADGVYVAQYQLYVDYVATGSPVSLTFTFGASVTASAAWTEGAETTAMAVIFGVNGLASWTEGAETQALSVSVSGVSVTASVAWTEGAETQAVAIIAAPLGVSLNAAWTEGAETQAVTINAAPLGISLNVAWTEGAETQAVAINAASLGVLLNAAWVEGSELIAVICYTPNTYARAPSGAGYPPRLEYSKSPMQVNTRRL